MTTPNPILSGHNVTPQVRTDMVTVAYAMPNAALSDLLAQFRKLQGAVVEREGTVASVKMVKGDKSKTMLAAMQHSNRKVWLVRAVAGLVDIKA